MADLDTLMRMGRPVAGHRPWPRSAVPVEVWREATALLASGKCTLVSL